MELIDKKRSKELEEAMERQARAGKKDDGKGYPHANNANMSWSQHAKNRNETMCPPDQYYLSFVRQIDETVTYLMTDEQWHTFMWSALSKHRKKSDPDINKNIRNGKDMQ